MKVVVAMDSFKGSLRASTACAAVRGGAREPEPRVSFGARLIDARSGQIGWMHGQHRGGWDGLNLFGTGRTHSRGRLAQHMMRSLVAGFLEDR